MRELFKKYLRNQCSLEEVSFLLKQFENEENKELLSNLVIQQLDAEEDLIAINEKEQESILAQAYSNIKSQIFFENNPDITPLSICSLCLFSDDCTSFIPVHPIYWLAPECLL